jgi:tRNA-Thr(GGU) m(6)t(6)A37 methyltransferase TsaA
MTQGKGEMRRMNEQDSSAAPPETGRAMEDTAVEGPRYEVIPIGWVESPLIHRGQAPRQADEGAPSAWLVFEPHVAEGIASLRAGDRVIVLTWLDRARRDVLTTHPRDDPTSPLTGVFSTRSSDRPNPIGLHPVTILAIDGLRVRVDNLEAINATPILDVKPVLMRRDLTDG